MQIAQRLFQESGGRSFAGDLKNASVVGWKPDLNGFEMAASSTLPRRAACGRELGWYWAAIDGRTLAEREVHTQTAPDWEYWLRPPCPSQWRSEVQSHRLPFVRPRPDFLLNWSDSIEATLEPSLPPSETYLIASPIAETLPLLSKARPGARLLTSFWSAGRNVARSPRATTLSPRLPT